MKAATVPAYPPDPPRGSITEGLDIVPAFSTLIREGKAAQYHWLAEAMRGKGVWPSPSSWEGMRVASLWEGFEIEQRAVSSTTELPPTYLRTVRVWIGMKERPCTEEEVNDLKDGVERRGWEWDPDLPRTTSDIHIATGPEDEQYPGAFPTTADLARHQFPKLDIPELGTEEHFRRWAEEFAAEVAVCVERFREHEGLPNELARLIAALQTFEVGTAEGAGLILELRGQAKGQGILTTMNDDKARLLRGLEKLSNATKPKTAKARPPIPSIAERFAKVPGSLDKWMGLLRSEGLVNAEGSFAMEADAKGKGRLIAAWTAAQELHQLDGYATDNELVQALKGHIPGLTGLDRLDKVRQGKTFSDLVTEYKEELQAD